MNKNDLVVLERFYNECLKFWEREGVENPKAQALEDVKRITTNPFVPRNAPALDTATKEYFIKTKE